jgi:hypothetical protein
VHTVVEMPGYLADVKAARLTEAEREAVVDTVAMNPRGGLEISGTGGARKFALLVEARKEWRLSGDYVLVGR